MSATMNVNSPSQMPAPRHRLEPGDRFPDFVLADQTGTPWGLYQRAQGMGVALFLDSNPALRDALRDLAEAYRAAGLSSAIVDAGAEGAAPSPTIVADSSGRFRQGLREMSGRPSKAAGARPL